MTSSNGNIFRVTGPLCGEFTGPGEFPAQRPVTRSFDVFFDLCLNKRLSKQPWGWWFETPAWSLWRHRNDYGNHVHIMTHPHINNKQLACTLPIHLQQWRLCWLRSVSSWDHQRGHPLLKSMGPQGDNDEAGRMCMSTKSWRQHDSLVECQSLDIMNCRCNAATTRTRVKRTTD